MIDTVKIYAEIDEETYQKIHSQSIVKSSVDNSTGELFYNITTGFLVGSFDNRLSVRVDSGVKYGFVDKGYCIEIEGSLHKYLKGYNGLNGYYDLEFVCKSMIRIAELSYFVNLPNFSFWYLQRCDIAICYDLGTQGNVISYINSLCSCKYPRRKAKFFYNESLYLSGTTTTLKVYNKLLEFRKHDIRKLSKTSFNVFDYMKKIQGFVRFECEIKKRMLKKYYGENLKHIKVENVNYEALKSIWEGEFMKVLKLIKSDLELVKNREDVFKRLYELFKPCKANRLYAFYCSLILEGQNNIFLKTSPSVYYRNISDLKYARIDFSQNLMIVDDDSFEFNPFEFKEVV